MYKRQTQRGRGAEIDDHTYLRTSHGDFSIYINLHALFNRAMEVPCDGYPTWRDPKKHASENKHAMGARRAEIIGRKKFSEGTPARSSPNSNKHASQNKHAMGASWARTLISVIARFKKCVYSKSLNFRNKTSEILQN